jgi:Bacterial archaeo-eukaryotic release factor family 7
MVDILTREDLTLLLKSKNRDCLSLFIPTAKSGPDVRQNSTRFRNLLARAEAFLSERGASSSFPEGLLDSLRKLVPDTFFWANQNTGLAVFRSPEVSLTYRLPMECHELVTLTDHFHVKPLIPVIEKDRKFYVLALSQKETRLLRCSFQESTRLVPKDMPGSLAEALKYDDPQRQLQFHTRTQASGGGRRAAMFHGQGVGIDESKDNLLRYFQKVNKSLEALLREEKAPLIVACVDYLFPIYKEANTYSYLVEQFIEGNPEPLSSEELQMRAWPIAESLFRREEEKALSAFEEKAGLGLTSTNEKEVVPAAHYGRVDSLFVAVDQELWGIFDSTKNEVLLQNSQKQDNYDLLNFAAMNTILHGGRVFALPKTRMPDGLIAALYRF